MFIINLDEEERAILLQLLETCISDIHEEITRTENLSYKSMLKKRKEILKKLQASLQQHSEDVSTAI